MKETTSIYQDMAQRTGGSVYIGVVGPVRTGKSTFVKRFMETLVLPHIDNAYRRDRAQDELPQSGSGRTIMTAEPKFVPEEAVQIRLEEGAAFSVRLVDCVGYMVDSAVGQFEDLAPRMVMTPWFDHEIPMTEAAEIGTRKVITDHATVGVVVTTDGTVTDIPRETGYGIVMPGVEELNLEDPEIVRQGGRYGVRMRASAPSIHLIRADIETTVSPIVGNEKQSEDMVNYLLQEFEGDTGKLWQSNIFGRSFHEIVGEDLQAKLKRMPADAQAKLRQALERIINEGGGGLICIIL